MIFNRRISLINPPVTKSLSKDDKLIVFGITIAYTANIGKIFHIGKQGEYLLTIYKKKGSVPPLKRD